MVLQPDQIRVCAMLKETITLLCRNGLLFQAKFAIDAVICVTLDDENMFHVAMNEVIEKEATEEKDYLKTSNQTPNRSECKKRKHKHHASQNNESPDGFCSDDMQQHKFDDSQNEADDTGSKHSLEVVKHEPFNHLLEFCHTSEDEDIVTVKQEVEDGCREPVSQENTGFSFLSDMSLANNSTLPTPTSIWGSNNASASSTVITDDGRQLPAPSTLGGDNAMGSKKKCPVCGKLLSTSSMKKHMGRHLGIHQYSCPHCPKGYTCKQDLDGHMFVHTGVLPFHCELCGKGIRWKAALMYHMNVCPNRAK